ncbi:MAG: DUF393 domain-containing protein [Planctomycetota bacterium]
MSTVPLLDPDQHPDGDVVIYDGDCNFCIGQVQRLARWDWRKRLRFLSLHDPRVADRYPDLSHDQLMEQMYVVSPEGKRFGGSDAVRYLSWRLPLLWPAMPILHLPGTAWLWRWMYRQVAKRRYRLAGKASDCEGSCSVHWD